MFGKRLVVIHTGEENYAKTFCTDRSLDVHGPAAKRCLGEESIPFRRHVTTFIAFRWVKKARADLILNINTLHGKIAPLVVR